MEVLGVVHATLLHKLDIKQKYWNKFRTKQKLIDSDKDWWNTRKHDEKCGLVVRKRLSCFPEPPYISVTDWQPDQPFNSEYLCKKYLSQSNATICPFQLLQIAEQVVEQIY